MERTLEAARRIPAYRWHASRGAIFKTAFGGELVAHYGRGASAEAALASRLAAVDLSAAPRCGFKGRGTVEWLAAQGIVIPDAYNRVARQADGSMVLRCGSTDIVIAGDVRLKSNRPAELKAVHAAGSQVDIGYDALREEGYAWFMLIGERAPALLAHVCEVDLRPQAFRDLEIAQTRVANLSAIVARSDFAGHYAVHLFFDIASAVYFCETFSGLLIKLDGSFIGHDWLLA